jgi:NAD(P)-dependent dehydrogenase (short-subunit alcohol dehydrogenase family)
VKSAQAVDKQMTSFLQRIFGLAGKTALITSASSGIGTVLAVGLAEAGATVGVHGRSAEKVAETCRQIEAMGGRAQGFSADLADIEWVSPTIGTPGRSARCAGR